jgi:hypothetical protein
MMNTSITNIDVGVGTISEPVMAVGKRKSEHSIVAAPGNTLSRCIGTH